MAIGSVGQDRRGENAPAKGGGWADEARNAFYWNAHPVPL